MRNAVFGLAVALLLVAASASAQMPPSANKAPTPHAAIVPAAEMAAAVKRNATDAVDDAVLRVVPVGTDYNVGTSVVRRSQVDGLTPPDAIVRELTGPSSVGKRIRGGTLQRVGPGDLVVIPPHTPHGFVEISTERIAYSLIRVGLHPEVSA